MAGNVKLMTSAGGGVVLDTATTTATDVTVKVPVTGVNNGTLVCSDSSGNVGIGTSSPSCKLQILAADGANSILSQISGGTKNPYLTVSHSESGGFTKLNADGSLTTGCNMVLATAGTERMRIDSSGTLLVGKTVNNNNTVGFAVQPTGVVVSTVSSDLCAMFNRQTSTGQLVLFRYNNGDIGNISTSGSATAYNTTSDYRLKENVQPMQNALGVVAQLNPVTYTWKADGSDGQGFIAHELQAVVPDCVTGEKDAVDEEGNPVYQGIDTSFLVATLTKAIQEQQAQIETLTAKVAALETK